TPPRVKAVDDVDAAFWDAVEREDLEALGAAISGEDAALDALRPALPALSSWRRRRRAGSETDGWRYRLAWAPLTRSGEPVLNGTWLLVTPPGDTEDTGTLADALRAAGATPVRVTLDTAAPDRQQYAARIGEVLAAAAPTVPMGLDGIEGPFPVAGVLSLLADADAAHPEGEHTAVPAALPATAALIQALGDLDQAAPLWCATRQAVSVGGLDAVHRPEHAAIWGLGRVAAQEYPDRWGGLVDLPAVLDARTGARLCAVLARREEDQTAVRTSGVFAARLEHAGVPAGPGAEEAAWRPGGTTLITGGTGALGAQVAKALARNGAEHLLLLSRRGDQAPGAGELAAELKELGAAVTIAACDAADRDALARVLAAVPTDQPLTAVVHAAGLLDDGVLDRLTPDRFTSVLAAKAAAARHLHELTAHQDLSAFVLFSSVAGTVPGPGQGSYAAANAYLDALAAYRGARGLAATSVAWGPWAEGGMVADSALVEGRVSRGGLPVMAAAKAVAALERAVLARDTYVAIADVDWERFAPGYAAVRPSPLLAGVPEARAALTAAVTASPGTDLLAHLAGASEAERQRLLAELVLTEVALVLGHASPAAIDPRRAFRDMGFDSLTAVELRNRLGKATGTRLATTLVFDYPTPEALTGHLYGELVPEPSVPGLRELDALQASLTAPDADPARRDAVTERLRALLSALDGARTGASGESVTGELEGATDDEVFEFIGKEFGIS
uniref:SDR family NAD(P)-dependent oxidoreductase n=1 Tax=Streptomyces sp. HPF1205 TaxID=2873262 RepID=UPI001CECBBC8